MLKRILFSLFFLLLSTVSKAAWQETGIPYATHALDISAAVNEDDTLRIFVADSSYRLYRSSNQGINWQIISDDNSYNPSCVLAISGSDTVFISRYMEIGSDTVGVYRSVDKGVSWHFRGAPHNIRVLTLCPLNPPNSSALYAGCDTIWDPEKNRLDYPLFQSSDGGISWNCPYDNWDPEDTLPGSTPALFNPVLEMLMDYKYYPEPDVYLAVKRVAGRDEGGIYWFRNRGIGGSDAYPKLPGNARAIVGRSDTAFVTLYAGLYSGDSMGVWKTVQTDEDWTFMDSTAYPITAIAIDPTSIEDTLSSNDTLYVGTDGYGIMRSTDGGSSWSFVNTGIYCKNILDIDVDPVNNNRVYAGAQWSFYVSADYGQSWTEQIQGMKKAQISGVGSNAPTKYCIGEFDILYESTDSGSSWTSKYAFEGMPGFEGSDHIRAKLLTVNQHNPDKLFASVYAPTSAGGYDNDRIWRSTEKA